jgi:competence protein ComEA
MQRLAVRVPVRLDPGRRTALAVGVAVLAAAVLTGLWLLAERPKAVAVSSGPAPIPGASSPVGSVLPSVQASASAAASGLPAPRVSTALVVVDVAGKVHHPGLYRLPPGSRVADALAAAGGALARVDLDSLNLAAKVVDGQQILVGVRGPVGGGVVAPDVTGGPPAAGGSTTGPVDLNTATLEQLESLPGIGPVLAQNILDWRSAHGSFSTVDQLNDVTGIGAVKFATLRPLVTA